VAGTIAVHGEFSSADASGLTEPNARISLFQTGTTTAVALAAGDVLVITDLSVVAGAALTVTVFDGADATVDAGETILKGDFAAKTNLGQRAATPFECQAGTYAHVKTSGAGQIDAQLRGYVRKA
jgi:hypothetical protein